ncbi:T9SS-dependent M36 family metallopeptidase [Candidatus Marifrigoribacter sp. Uisw_064]|uniref:T9SS-dependent M36 family metallopeptidase n=1 Tax=Candidatus Marifrigoribacter sp. Uisw_064 TaxID=3230970 RepID=UPI003D3C955A
MKKIIYLLAFFTINFAFAQDFSQNINSYLNNNRAQLGLEAQDVEDFNIASQSFSKSMQLHNVYVTQQYQGIDIFNTTSSFAVKNNTVVNANITFVQNATEKVNTTSPAITAENAISRAATSLGIQSPSNLTLLETISNQSFVFSNGSISLENIPVKLVFQYDQENMLKLAWDLSIYLLDASHYYNVRIDAVTGALLDTNDWVVSCNFGEPSHSNLDHNKTENSILFSEEKEASLSFDAAGGAQYRVFPMPVESPNHGLEELVADPADANASPFGWHDTNGADGAEFTTTRGNNVLAQEDINANNGSGAMPDGGAGLNFDFPYDFDNPPVQMVDAATVNLFYWNNIMHDVYYQYGFDEESGNFQENNYGEAGNGSDSVNADAQDGGGTNNANFATPPDGANPRMQMFLWGSPAGDLLTVNNGPLAGGYLGIEGDFGGSLTTTPITEDLALASDGSGPDDYDVCDPIINGGDLSGKIAILRRGECEFGFKVLAAENEGAIAVIVVNNVPGGAITMAGGVNGGSVTIPSIMVSMADGDALIAELIAGNTVNGSLSLPANTPPELDGDVDNGIIAHEYGHGISNRLTGGPTNTGCLSNAEQMGEGWSDWVGLMLTMEPGDQPEDIRGIGTYATGQSTDGGGIREAPYSTDFAINPYTYVDTNNNVSQPHGIGFVWSTMLWDLNWALIDEYGWDADFYNGTGGNNIAIQLVMDGMKLQVCSPGFVDGRDAILEADELVNAGANRCLIWEVFANRGLGFSADQGSSSSRSDQTEAFDLPADCNLGANDNGSLENNFNIYPNPSKGIVNIQSRLDLGSADISVFDINGRKVFNQNVEIQNVISINTENLSAGIYILQINGENYSHTTKLIIE